MHADHVAVLHQRAYAEPHGHRDQHDAEIPHEPSGRPDEHPHGAAPAVRADVAPHAALDHPDAQQQQRQPEPAADGERRTPRHELGHEESRDGAQDADRRHDRRREAATLAAGEFGHQGDARAELSGESDPRDEAQHLVLPDGGAEPGRMQQAQRPRRVDVDDHGVEQVRDRVGEDAAEEHREPAKSVAEHPPQDAADHQARHLQRVVEPDAPVLQQQVVLLRGRLGQLGREHLGQAALAQQREQEQVEDVDEVSERGHDDRQRDRTPAGRWLRGSHCSRAPAARVAEWPAERPARPS
jgi:hypothetical protein